MLYGVGRLSRRCGLFRRCRCNNASAIYDRISAQRRVGRGIASGLYRNDSPQQAPTRIERLERFLPNKSFFRCCNPCTGTCFQWDPFFSGHPPCPVVRDGGEGRRSGEWGKPFEDSGCCAKGKGASGQLFYLYCSTFDLVLSTDWR